MKKINYILMTLLILFELGYVFTGNFVHEVAGITVVILMIIHHASYKHSFKNLFNIILFIDLFIVGLSGISISRDLTPFIQIPFLTVDIHHYASYLLVAMLSYHIGKYSLTKLKGKKKQMILIALSLVMGVGCFYGIPFLNRRFKTIVLEDSVLHGEKIEMNRKVLTVYFSWQDNCEYQDKIDISSTASVCITKDGEYLGTSEATALAFYNRIDSDIDVIYTSPYPSSYSKTVGIAGKEIGKGKDYHLDKDLDPKDYDLVILVYPLWYGTLPEAVNCYLQDHDFSTTDLAIVVSHGGSKLGSSQKAVYKAIGKNPQYAYDLYCEDIMDCEKEIISMIEDIKQ